ncbi:MAG: hypothetical protein MZU79_07615 [Anaerotruncus sp.]|nr:hypothetical protein [Anaerotruncus sp.]
MPALRREARRQVQDLGPALRLLPGRLRDLQLRDHGLAHLGRRPDPRLPLPAGHVLLGEAGRAADQPGRRPAGRDPPAGPVRPQRSGAASPTSARTAMSFVADGEVAGPAQGDAPRDRRHPRRRKASSGRRPARSATWSAPSEDEGPGLKYGVQFGISRMSIQSVHAPDPDFARRGEGPRGPARGPGRRPPADFVRSSLMSPHVIRLENRRGEEIVGLLNTSLPLDDRPVPVVVIPPAFGKTKEVLFGLALTLVRELPAPGQAPGRRPLRRHPQEGREPQRSRGRRAALRDAQHQLQPGRRRTS